MPEVHFVGEIECSKTYTDIYFNKSTSITWAVVTGNSSWTLQNGEQSGETQICSQSVNFIYKLSYLQY